MATEQKVQKNSTQQQQSKRVLEQGIDSKNSVLSRAFSAPKKTMSFIEIQNEVVKQYRIDLCDGTKCANDWSRTHAHIRQRRVCKWKQRNSIQSTFDLFHEIGHIETTKSWMRRCEEEYYATLWAIEKCKEYGLTVPAKTIQDFQDYIDDELERGKRRGGTGYRANALKLPI